VGGKMTTQKTPKTQERKLDSSLELDKILPKIPFGPNAPLLIDPVPRFCNVPTHPARQASYQLGKGLLDYLHLPFSEIDGRIEFSPFFMQLARNTDQYLLVCPIYFDFAYPAPKGFKKSDWEEITKGLEGLTCVVYTSGDIFSTNLSHSSLDTTKNLIPKPTYGLDRLTPMQLIHSWYNSQIPHESLIFPGRVQYNGYCLELTETQKNGKRNFMNVIKTVNQ
jgi:hypothetical protein